MISRIEASLEREAQVAEADANVKVGELQAILEDIGVDRAESFPCFITKLRRPRLAEWFARWSDEAYKEAHADRGAAPMPFDLDFGAAATAELSLLRDLQKRLHPLPDDEKKSPAVHACRSIVPRSTS